ncbi:hypothetical protein B0H16DRAFT_1499618 [Mycena metata]|uniref:F-box domain-containing protein n=1 Tax=Mycena metata TaxID=1033252 RepID=A0AAD7NY36_9AGAR|nr:hypothetical protein B0H16DRAFT_1499618 [Mycena metata]
MHPTLHIPELVGAVFRNLDPSWTEDAQLQDLAVLARTCTGFHDIALDALWRHQYGILNLIRCMPADLWEVVEADAPQNNRPVRRILRPMRAIVPSDWDRVLKYSYRVKSLTSVGYAHYKWDSSGSIDMVEIFQTLLHSAPAEHLLPNLTELAWHHAGTRAHASTFPFIALFLSPRLTSLTIEEGINLQDQEEVFASLARSHSNLTILRLESPFAPNRTLEARTQLIRTLTHVQWVKVGTVDVAALMHLGQLQSLDTLGVSLPASIFPTAATRTLFQNLESAQLLADGEDLRPLTSFLRSWKTPKVYSFDVPIDSCPKPNEVEEVYRTLAEHCCHASLESFSLGYYDIPDPQTQPHAPAFIYPGSGIRPLFCFNGLQADDPLPGRVRPRRRHNSRDGPRLAGPDGPPSRLRNAGLPAALNPSRAPSTGGALCPPPHPRTHHRRYDHPASRPRRHPAEPESRQLEHGILARYPRLRFRRRAFPLRHLPQLERCYRGVAVGRR